MPIIQDSWLNVPISFSILQLYVYLDPNNIVPIKWKIVVRLLVAFAKLIRFIQIGMALFEYNQPHQQEGLAE
jgi:hypothetical protein